MLKEPASHSVTSLVVGSRLFLLWLQHLGLLLQASQHTLNRLLKVLRLDALVQISGGNQSRFIAHISNVSTYAQAQYAMIMDMMRLEIFEGSDVLTGEAWGKGCQFPSNIVLVKIGFQRF